MTETIIDRLLDHGPVELLTLSEDGARYRETLSPGDDISHLGEDIRGRIAAHWTPARQAEWEEIIRVDDALPGTEV